MRISPFTLLGVLALLWLPSLVNAATALTVTPSSIENTYTGDVTLAVTGLITGQTVRMEAYLDLNANTAADTAEPLMQSYTVTDGVAPAIGGRRNPVMPGDEDGAANGRMNIIMHYAFAGGLNRLAGRYVIVVRNTAGTALASKAFTIAQHNYGQTVTGTVTATGGTAVPGAFVLLYRSNLHDREHVELVTGTLTNAAGQFSMQCPPGRYVLTTVRSGYVSTAQWSAVTFTVTAGQNTTRTITLLPANRLISGKITDSVTGKGIPTVFVNAEVENLSASQNGLLAVAITDRWGNYTMPVVDGNWYISVNGRDTNNLAVQGYVGGGDYASMVDTHTGNVTGINVAMKTGTVLFHGTAVGSDGTPLTGIQIDGVSNSGDWGENVCITDSTGQYFMAALPGVWNLWVDGAAQYRLGYLLDAEGIVTSSSTAGQAVLVPLTLRKSTTHLMGTVVDETGAPVPYLPIIAHGSDDHFSYTLYGVTGANGVFDFGVLAGAWSLYTDDTVIALFGFFDIIGRRNYTVTTGVNQQNIVYQVTHATTHLRGTAVDSNGDPVADALIIINGAYTITQPSARVLYYGFVSTTNAQGQFDIGVVAPSNNGQWVLSFSADSTKELLSTVRTFQVVNGVDQNAISVVMPNITTSITGSVKNSTGLPIAGARVSANMVVGDDTYYSSAQTDGTGHYRLPMIAGQCLINAVSFNPSISFPGRMLMLTNAGAVVDFVPTVTVQPDMMVRAQNSTSYRGNNTYTDGTAQTAEQGAANGAVVTFILKVQNDGNITDQFTITNISGMTPTTFRVFDAVTGGNEVTAQANGGGWKTEWLAPGAFREFRIEVSAPSSVRLRATSQTDTAKTDAVRALSGNIAPTAVNLATSLASPTIPGMPVKLTATATGGFQVEYRFLIQQNGAWTIVQDWGASNTYNWTTPPVGAYQLQVYAREAGSTASVYKTVPFTVKAPVSAVLLRGYPLSPILPGTSVTFAATPSDGGTLEYRFLQQFNGIWTEVRGWSRTNTYTWTPTQIGSYAIQVRVRDVGTKVIGLLKSTAYKVAPPITSLTMNTSSPSPVTVGSTVIFTAQAAGGTTPEFRFLIQQNGTWTQAQAYSTNNTYSWAPTAPGSYIIQVRVREQGSVASYTFYKSLFYTVK